MMEFRNIGLVTDDQGDQVLFIPWREVHSLYQWVMVERKHYYTHPMRQWTREQVGFVLANYEDAMSSF